MSNAVHVSVDVEANGPCPGLFSLISIGAVVVEPQLNRKFYCETAPVKLTGFECFMPQAYEACGVTLLQHELMPDARSGIVAFSDWALSLGGRPILWSDNPAFDWQFVNYYLHAYTNSNPFGFSARRIGDYYAGLKHDVTQSTAWKKLRKTKHTHNALDDAMGNAEALLQMPPFNKF